jgi:murein DD-endopeptidase MepM/ murein hydrolase activator NlpD
MLPFDFNEEHKFEFEYRGFDDYSHPAIDFYLPEGTEILAAADGRVITAEYGVNGYGNYVVIQHNDNLKTLYAHCNEILVQEGDIVTQGQTIATVGTTGRVTGPQLHFEVIISGEHAYLAVWGRLDPEYFMTIRQGN